VCTEKEGGDKLQATPSTRKWAQNNDYDPELVFDKLFRADIEYLHTMDKLWKNRAKPCVLKYDALDNCDASTSAVNPVNGDQALKDQRMWSLQECFQVFAQSVHDLKDRLKTENFLVWDKDDETALNFVTSVSNLRSHCFHIERKSKFDVKSMAGNIIPAISSTNSIVGGLMVLQIINLLRKLETIPDDQKSDSATVQQAYRSVCKHVYLRQISTVFGNLIAPYQIFEPNESCLVCNTKHIPEIEVAFNFNQTSMSEFVEELLLKRLNFVCPDIQLDGLPIIVWSKDDADEYTDEEFNAYRNNPLSSHTSIQHRTRLRVEDLIQNLTMILTVANEEINVNENNGLFYKLKIIREADTAQSNDSSDKPDEPSKSDQAADSNNPATSTESEEDTVEIVPIESNGTGSSEVAPKEIDTEQIESNDVASKSNGSTKPANNEIVNLSDEEESTDVAPKPMECEDDELFILEDSNAKNNSNFSKVITETSSDDECEIIEQSNESTDQAKDNQTEDKDVQLVDREEKRKAGETPEEAQAAKKIRIN
jgi:ubiquitin-like 1-activating enzyme E1 B